jgi:hypothetical protein
VRPRVECPCVLPAAPFLSAARGLVPFSIEPFLCSIQFPGVREFPLGVFSVARTLHFLKDRQLVPLILTMELDTGTFPHICIP